MKIKRLKNLIFLLFVAILIIPNVSSLNNPVPYPPLVEACRQNYLDCDNCILLEIFPEFSHSFDLPYVGGEFGFDLYFENISNKNLNGDFNIIVEIPNKEPKKYSISYNLAPGAYLQKSNEIPGGGSTMLPINSSGTYKIIVSEEKNDVKFIGCKFFNEETNEGLSISATDQIFEYVFEPVPSWEKSLIIEERKNNEVMENIADDNRSISNYILWISVAILFLTSINVIFLLFKK